MKIIVGTMLIDDDVNQTQISDCFFEKTLDAIVNGALKCNDLQPPWKEISSIEDDHLIKSSQILTNTAEIAPLIHTKCQEFKVKPLLFK